jgi:hypothetical protein
MCTPTLFNALITAVVDGVAHHGVSDLERGGRRRRIAQHNDHIVHQLDAGRCGRYRRKQIEPPKDVLVVNLALDLAKSDRYSQRRCPTRIRHRTVCAVCNGLIPTGGCRFDAVAGQERTFDLHKMDVVRIDDGRLGHGGGHRPRRFPDLHAAPDLLGQKIPRVRHPNAEAFPGNVFGIAFGSAVTREDGYMWTKHTLRTTRHHERDPLLHAVRWQIDIRRERSAECGHGVFPREIVDAAIAFGFAQYRDDRLWIDFALLDQGSAGRRHHRGLWWQVRTTLTDVVRMFFPLDIFGSTKRYGKP